MSDCDFSYPLGARQITPAEKERLRILCKENNCKIILEIGSWVGESTSVFAEYARDNNAIVYCVDWFKGNKGTTLIDSAKTNDIYSIFKDNMQKQNLWNYVNVYRMPSKDAVKKFTNYFFDFIFLDADHRYSHVKHDIYKWMPKLKSGGVFCGHDYDSDDYDEEHIERDYVNNRHNGLIKAVQEFFGKNSFKKGEGSLWWIIKK